GSVTAWLRRWAAAPPSWPDPGRDPAGWATTRGSHPAWIVAEVLDRLGPQELVALVEADNRRPEVSLRATPGRATRDQLLAELTHGAAPVLPSPLSPDCVVLEHGDPGRLAAVTEGRAVVQDAASALVAPAVGGGPGDLVAHPGARARGDGGGAGLTGGGRRPGRPGGRPGRGARGQGRPPGRARRPGPGRRGPAPP